MLRNERARALICGSRPRTVYARTRENQKVKVVRQNGYYAVAVYHDEENPPQVFAGFRELRSAIRTAETYFWRVLPRE
jgi:hypothetical protein